MSEQRIQGAFLQGLHTELLRVLPAKCHKCLDSWMESGTVRLEPKDQGVSGVDVAWLTYHAVFSLEALPFRDFDPAILLAVVAAWVQEHDDYRERFDLPDPTYAVVPADEHTADVEIELQFIEPLSLVADPAGPVRYAGKTWTVAQSEVWFAEHITLHVANSQIDL
ncbi:phage tail protein [Aeromonas hydrophila]|uniref:phage tail protein n=1 Tax=Aeromonas hydrophila TaxID=644 RepID=UPI003D2036EC